MSIISPSLWEELIPDILCPEGCTYEQFYLVREQIWHDENRVFENWWVKTMIRLAKHFPDDPDIVASCKEVCDNSMSRMKGRP